MNQYYKNRVIVITGASSGIGKACALGFAHLGARVALASRNVDKLEELKSYLAGKGFDSLAVKTDLTSIYDCKNLIDKTLEKYGQLYILVNNAGVSMRACFENLDLKVLQQVMETNFYGMGYCTKFALPYIEKQKGTIIGISSITGLNPLPGRSAYATSKHAMDGFLSSLWLEVKRKNINILVVHLGFTSSCIRENALT